MSISSTETGSVSPSPSRPESYLRRLGVFGFEAIEPVILTALITEDPLLLIGPSGTGKTYLLNRLSEALGLNHRHYNASLIAFDDLVGFPYPEEDRAAVRYLETPATVWGAESVLVDEISRCRPEHQNRFFSLIHERRLQGLPLKSLRFRWAAMNPVSVEQRPGDHYAGSEPLDVALADRFGCIVEVPDWRDLDEDDRQAIARPELGTQTDADDGGALERALAGWVAIYSRLLAAPPEHIVRYAERVVTLLDQSNLRLSPRRARQLSRSLLGISALRGGMASEEDVLSILRASMPQRAWGQPVADEALRGAHEIAWESSFAAERDRWINAFLSEPVLARKVERLLDAPDPDTASIAIARTLAMASPEDSAAFSFALYPAALDGRLPIGKEGVSDLARIGGEIVTVRGILRWREKLDQSDTSHPGMARMARALLGLQGTRRERAVQLFHWCVVNNVEIGHPEAYEQSFDDAVAVLRRYIGVAA